MAPAFDAMRTTPRERSAIYFPPWRKERKKLSIVGELNAVVWLELMWQRQAPFLRSDDDDRTILRQWRDGQVVVLEASSEKFSGEMLDKPVTTIRRPSNATSRARPTVIEK